MKKPIYLLIILFAFGCQTVNDATIKFLDEGTKLSNNILTNEMYYIYSQSVARQQENPERFGEIYDILEVVKASYGEIEYFLCENYNPEDFGGFTQQQQQEQILTLVEKHKLKIKEIAKSLEINIDFDKVLNLNYFEETKMSEKELNLLLNRTNYATFLLTKAIEQKYLNVDIFHFNDVITFPKLNKEKLKINEVLEAKIYLVAVDTNMNIKANINNKEYENKGFIPIQKKIKSEEDKKLKGYLYFPKFYDTLKYSFNFQF